MCPEEGTYLAHRQGNPLLGLLPREYAHFGLWREHRGLHGDSNIFVVRGGTLYTSSERYVLPGISRQMTLNLARKLAIPAIEGDIDLFDAANTEEMFLTSTSL